jgi:hypothetical protein
MIRNHEFERNREGDRGWLVKPGQVVDFDEDDYWGKYLGPGFEPKTWRQNEVVLLPLAKLKGLSKVRIGGTVTEAWTMWLETAMIAELDQTVPEYEFHPEAMKAIGRLKGGKYEKGRLCIMKFLL